MEIVNIPDNEIVATLNDIGINKKQIEEFLENIHKGYTEKNHMILLRQRKSLLLSVHDYQNRLYCLDFFTKKLKDNHYI